MARSPELTIDFQPVPDYTAGGISEVIPHMDKHFDKRRRSYGAFIIHDVLDNEMDLLASQFEDYPKLAKNRQYDCLLSGGDDIRLHTDIGTKRQRNDYTLHYTTAGIGEFIILAGSKFLGSDPSIDTYDELARTKKLFENNVLDTALDATAPRIAYRSPIKPGDLVVFDHTQPHAFRSIDSIEPRQAKIHFFFPQ